MAQVQRSGHRLGFCDCKGCQQAHAYLMMTQFPIQALPLGQGPLPKG